MTSRLCRMRRAGADKTFTNVLRQSDHNFLEVVSDTSDASQTTPSNRHNPKGNSHAKLKKIMGRRRGFADAGGRGRNKRFGSTSKTERRARKASPSRRPETND